MMLRLLSTFLALNAAAAAPELSPGADLVCAGARLAERPGPAVPPENSESLLWEVETPGVAPSYIFGTMHSAVSTLPPEFDALAGLIRASRSVALERDLDPSAQYAFGRRLSLPEGTTLSAIVDPGLHARVLALAERRGLSPQTAEGLRAWALIFALEQASPGFVLDQALSAKALESGKPVSGLEALDELADTMDSIPLAVQAAVLRDGACNAELNARVAAETAALYAAGDLAGVAILSERFHPAEGAHAEAFLEKVLYERNARMAARAAPFLKEGAAFVAVGALHLPGSMGLLRLLQKGGFVVLPVDLRSLTDSRVEADPETMARLMEAAGAVAGSPPPELAFASPARLRELACRGAEDCPHAAFFDSGRTIYLHEGLRRRLAWGEAGAQGILLTQLVYYVQELSGRYSAGSDCDTWRRRSLEASTVYRGWMRRAGGPMAGLGGPRTPPQCSWDRGPA